jgi:hypothetical protein
MKTVLAPGQPDARCPSPSLITACALVLATSLAGCSTEEVGSDKFLLTSEQTGTNTATMAVALAEDFDTFEQRNAAAAAGHVSETYFLRVDGRWALLRSGDMIWQPPIGPGTFSASSWIPAGTHRFELVDAAGHVVATTGPYSIESGKVNRLCFFGHRAALQHRFISIGLDVPAGQQRYSVLNLIRTGVPIEVITCSDTEAARPQECTVVSPPLAYGEGAIGDAPTTPSSRNPDGSSRYPDARGVYYRMAGASAPVPPLPLYLEWQTTANIEPADQVPIYVAAPEFMGSDGFAGGVLN